jgi:hypothetical protein
MREGNGNFYGAAESAATKGAPDSSASSPIKSKAHEIVTGLAQGAPRAASTLQMPAPRAEM